MSRRILVLDDEPLVRKSIARVLAKQHDFEIVEAAHNEEAMSAIAAATPDAIVMDLNRPRGDALDLMRDIAGLVRTRNIGVMVLSGDVDGVRRATPELTTLGVRRVATKPLDAPSLLAAIGELLRAPVDGLLALLLSAQEDANVDYKATIDLSSSEAVARLAKDVIAMTNTPGGGNIFFGVHQTKGPFEYRGLTKEQQTLFDPTLVNDALSKYTGRLTVKVALVSYGSANYGYLGVQEARDKIVLASGEHQGASLYRGRIYHRTDAARAEEVRDSATLEEMLERCIRARTHRF